jgi:HEAT repeat protein
MSGSLRLFAAGEEIVPRESLRYDGKDFTWWQNELQVELKPELRSEALRAMGIFGTNGYAEEATVAIIRVVKNYHAKSHDKDSQMVTGAANQALRKIGPPATKLLVGVLSGMDIIQRRFALSVLNSLPRTEESVAAFVRATKDSDIEARQIAVAALAKDGEGAVAALIHSLKDEDVQTRCYSAQALRQIGKDASAAAAGLAAALQDEQVEVRRSAIEALQAIGAEPRRLVPAFVAALEDEDREVRLHAVRALESMGREAKQAVPALVEGFKRADRRDRQLVLEALVRIVPEKENVVTSLVNATGWWRDDDPKDLDEATAEVLRKIAE